MNVFKRIFSGKKKEPTGCNVLSVEDSDIDHRLIENALIKSGYTVFWADNSEKGLEILGKEKIDLILLDCGLPGMSGVAFCKKLKENETLSRIPVIFLTSDDTPKNIIDCYEIGADNYLMKPISPRTLVAQVAMVLKEKTAEN